MIRRREEGQVAIISMIVLTSVGLVVGLIIGMLAVSEFVMTRNADDSGACFTSAEGGLKDVLVQIKLGDSDWLSSSYSDSYAQNEVTVSRTMTTVDSLKSIVVTGARNDTQRRLEATYNLDSGQVFISEVTP